MSKGNRTIVHVVFSAGTGYSYTTTKNKRKSQDKLQLKKYDPRVRKERVRANEAAATRGTG